MRNHRFLPDSTCCVYCGKDSDLQDYFADALLDAQCNATALYRKKRDAELEIAIPRKLNFGTVTEVIDGKTYVVNDSGILTLETKSNGTAVSTYYEKAMLANLKTSSKFMNPFLLPVPKMTKVFKAPLLLGLALTKKNKSKTE